MKETGMNRTPGKASKVVVPKWQYETFKRWFNKDDSESRKIAAEAARQAGER